jgi:acyl-CoA reductase-like NAD-dependent aldehyde dehydrogenase
MAASWDMVIDGSGSAAADAPTHEPRSPATGEVIGTFREGDSSHVAAAVTAARRALEDGWELSTGAERAGILRRLADRLRERAEEYARLESRQVGIPYGQVSWLNSYCADVVDFYAGAARMRFGRSAELSERRLGLTLEQPIGVVGVITPFNFPLVLTIWKVAAALAAGCTLVVKPDHETPITVIELARDLLDVGLPPGVCNVVTGKGSVVGEAIVAHPDIDKVSFTGSTATGQRVMQRAALTMKRVSLELGGKSPLIVLADADLDAAADAALECFYNAGQQCNVPSRLLVGEGGDAVVEQVVERARAKRLGSDDDADIGPLISAAALENVLGYVEGARAGGARILTGGSGPPDVGPGAHDRRQRGARCQDRARGGLRAGHGRPALQAPRRGDPARERR